MKKSILVGKDGKPSMATVFAEMKTPENSMIVNAKNKKTQASFFKLYNVPDAGQFTKVKDLVLNDAIVIRWGTRIQIPERDTIVYNTNKGINNSSNKYNARKMLQAAGVRIPKLVSPGEFRVEDLPIIARPFQHKQGKNFIVIKDFGSFDVHYRKNSGSWYYSAYVDKDAEYRVHCAHGRILSIMKKPKPADPNILAWNHAVVEDPFDALEWSKWDLEMGKQALRACKALELDFCALDVIVKDGVSYVLEANTCPSLVTSPYNTAKYAKYFDWLLRKEEKREHWEFEEKEKAASLAWKDWMFEDRQPEKKRK